jgi:hypothetical protein
MTTQYGNRGKGDHRGMGLAGCVTGWMGANWQVPTFHLSPAVIVAPI